MLQVCLRYIKHIENLILGIDIILFLLIIGEFLVIFPRNPFLGILVNDRESSEKDRKGLFALQDMNGLAFLRAFLLWIEIPLDAVEGTPDRKSVSLFLGMKHKHECIASVVTAAVQVAGPHKCPLGEPGLLPVMVD